MTMYRTPSEHISVTYETSIEIQKNISMKDMTQVDVVKAYDKATIYLECWSTDAKVALANKGINLLVDTARKFIKP